MNEILYDGYVIYFKAMIAMIITKKIKIKYVSANGVMFKTN